MDWTHEYRMLQTPLGEPGSGRIRYGAAMALFALGRLSPRALEIYRICSAHDGVDPVPRLAADGIAMPDLPAVTQ